MTNFILRIKEQETRLTLQEHDDDGDDDYVRDDDDDDDDMLQIFICLPFLAFYLFNNTIVFNFQS